MKRINIYVSILLLGCISFLTTSCEDLAFGDNFLEKAPSGDVTIDTIFSKAEYAREVLWYSYSTLPYGLNIGYNLHTGMYYGNLEALTDLSHSALSWDGPNQVYYSGLYNAGTEDATTNSGKNSTKYHIVSKRTWKGIRHAWILIENIDRVPDMSVSEKARLKAEAKVVIAIHYAEMLRHYGGLPIIDHALELTEIDFPKRATLQSTVDFIVTLLDEATSEPNLPWIVPSDEMSNWAGRLTRGAAMGLKLRVLLFVASPLFNSDEPYYPGKASDEKLTWFGDFKQKRWEDACVAGKAFIDTMAVHGGYGLVNNSETERLSFRNGYYTRGTIESLISTRKYYRNYNMNITILQAARWGASCGTLEYFNMFPMADGSKFDWNNLEHAKNPFVNRDPRLYETLLLQGDKFGSDVAQIQKARDGDDKNYPSGKHWGFSGILDIRSLSTGLPQRKMVLDRQGEFDRVIHWPYLRLAEVYLSYAEALAMCGKLPEAYNYVDEVRERVGMKGLESGLSTENFIKELLRERACEFGWEEVRFFDLIRYKSTDDFTKKLHGINLYIHNKTREMIIETKELPQRAWQKENGFSAKWFLSAFPSKEVQKGYGLIQNPGW